MECLLHLGFLQMVKNLIMSLAENGSTNIYIMNLILKTNQLTRGRSIDTSPSFSPRWKK